MSITGGILKGCRDLAKAVLPLPARESTSRRRRPGPPQASLRPAPPKTTSTSVRPVHVSLRRACAFCSAQVSSCLPGGPPSVCWRRTEQAMRCTNVPLCRAPGCVALAALAHCSFGCPSSQHLALTTTVLRQILPIYTEFFKDRNAALLPRPDAYSGSIPKRE